MNYLDEILTMRLLAFKHGQPQNNEFLDEELATKQSTKNVCAHLNVSLVERLENAVSLLNISKREFIQAALTDALDRVSVLANEHNVFEHQRPLGSTSQSSSSKQGN